MGPVQSHFTHHLTQTPCSTTYIYTRSNGMGAVESRHTRTSPSREVRSTITFSDGRGCVISANYCRCVANNFADYNNPEGPQDGFNQGDYSHLFSVSACRCYMAQDRIPPPSGMNVV